MRYGATPYYGTTRGRRKGDLRQAPEHYGGKENDRKSGEYGRGGAPPALGAYRDVQKGLVIRIRETPERRRNRDAYNPDRKMQKPRRRRWGCRSLRVFLQVGSGPCFSRRSSSPGVPAFRTLLIRNPRRDADDLRGGQRIPGSQNSPYFSIANPSRWRRRSASSAPAQQRARVAPLG